MDDARNTLKRALVEATVLWDSKSESRENRSKARTESTRPNVWKGCVSVQQTTQLKKEKHRVEKDDGNRVV